jgi:hypothetical protein
MPKMPYQAPGIRALRQRGGLSLSNREWTFLPDGGNNTYKHGAEPTFSD